ncbi:MAG: CDP-diacylglycerol--glycerol-3-phosphate 3-phosphatidyltransferase [Burkholderiales bacterium]
MVMNLPIAITWVRVAIIPVFIGVFHVSIGLRAHQIDAFAAGLFLLAAMSDWLDGWLARRLGQTSAFGAFLDPVADKLVVAAALVELVALQRIPTWIAVVIIGREIAVSALREWMATLGRRQHVAVNWLGKAKTVAQMTAILLLLYNKPLAGVDLPGLGAGLAWLAAALTIISMLLYLRAAMRAGV